MFTWTYVDLKYITSFSIWGFEMIIVLQKLFCFISVRYTIKFTVQK